jgi:hypothetical protein
MIRPLLINHPNQSDIEWSYAEPGSYKLIEKVLTDGVIFFEPFLVENWFPDEMFEELVSLLNSKKLDDVDFSHQMNKWEEGFDLPQKFIDYSLEKARSLIGTDDIYFAYNMYAHHQITDEGRVPRLPLHIDHAPGAYMIDLHIGGNREWGFVAGDTNFITKPNQAVICQPQFDYHYRPAWGTTDPNEYYQAFFLHLINKNHWCVPSESPLQDRDPLINKRFPEFGQFFRETQEFINYQTQRRFIFDQMYYKEREESGLPPMPTDIPTAEDSSIHQRKGVKPAQEDK